MLSRCRRVIQGRHFLSRPMWMVRRFLSIMVLTVKRIGGHFMRFYILLVVSAVCLRNYCIKSFSAPRSSLNVVLGLSWYPTRGKDVLIFYWSYFVRNKLFHYKEDYLNIKDYSNKITSSTKLSLTIEVNQVNDSYIKMLSTIFFR